MKQHVSHIWQQFLLAATVFLSVACLGIVTIWTVENMHYLCVFFPAISSGWLSGSLHAITGSDHLASLLPIILAQRWRIGLLYGAVWGLGHGLTSFTLGIAAYGMKRVIFSGVTTSQFLQRFRYLGDVVTASTILIIGIMGYYENASGPKASSPEESDAVPAKVDEEIVVIGADKEICAIEEGSNSTQVASATNIASTNYAGPLISSKSVSLSLSTSNKNISTKYTAVYYDSVKMVSVFVHGAVLGLSFDGLPSLAPAVVLDQQHVIAFLLSYWISTALIMSLVASIVSEASYFFTKRQQQISIVQAIDRSSNDENNNVEHSTEINYENRLARVASFAACLIGCGYLFLSLSRLYLQYFYSSIIHTKSTEEFPWVLFWMQLLAVSTISNDNNDGLPAMNDGTGTIVASSATMMLQSNDDASHSTLLVSLSRGVGSVDVILMILSFVCILIAVCYGLGGNIWYGRILKRNNHFHRQ